MQKERTITSLMTFQNTVTLLRQPFKAKSGKNHISNIFLFRSKTQETSYAVTLKTCSTHETSETAVPT